MSDRRLVLTGFMAGELDPHLDGRVDAEIYPFGLSLCENFVALNEGPLVKRQGFERVAAADPSSTWLTAFRRSIEAEYVLEWGEQKLRFFADGEPLESAPGTVYEISTPYLAAEAPAVSQQQSFDRLHCVHRNHKPGAIRRDAVDQFAFETIENENGPFLDTNTDEARTVSITSGGTGKNETAVIEGAAGFTQEQVGALFRIEIEDFGNIPQWEPGMRNIAVGEQVRNGSNVYVAETSGITGRFEPIHTEGGFFDGQLKDEEASDNGPFGVKWKWLHDRFGIVKIASVSGSNTATGVVQRTLPSSLTSVGSSRWAHAAFSDAEAWPHLVALFKGRLIYLTDLDIFGSVAGDFGDGRVNFSAFTSFNTIEADLAFRRTVGFENPPLWVSADRSLLVGTASVEMAIGPVSDGAAFSGTNIESEAQSYYGSEAVFPIKVGTETIFLERGARRMRAGDYDFGRDRYDATDLNRTSRHITTGGVIQLGFQRVPHAFAFAVRGDGQLLFHAKTRSEIFGFTRFVLGGGARALSAVSVVGADGRTDDVWLLVERENGAGQLIKEIWKQAPWRELGEDQREAFYVDGGVRLRQAANDALLTGLDHLAGQEVVALVNGVVVEDLTVDADGSLALPAATVPSSEFTAIVGLAYTAKATSMRPELRDRQGILTGMRQRVIKVILRVLETLGLQAQAQDENGPVEEVVARRGSQAMDEQVPLYSGDTEGAIDDEFDRDGRVTWISARPLPATITMAVLNIDGSTADA